MNFQVMKDNIKHPMLLTEMESKPKKSCDATENKADSDLHKCRIEQALRTLSGNTADENLAAAKSASKTEFSVERHPCNKNSIKKKLLHVSCIRGSPKLTTMDSKKNCEGSSFSVVGESTELNPKRCLDFDDLVISETDFYSSDVASEMLQRDQEDHEKADLDYCSYSSWYVCSEKDVNEITVILDSDSDQSRKKKVNISEFIAARTENLGSISDEPFRQRPYFGTDVVTPFPKDKILSSTPVTESSVRILTDNFAKQSISSKTRDTITQETFSSLPIRWNIPLKRESLTKESILEEFYRVLGIERNEIEDKNSAGNENVKWFDKRARNEHINCPQKVNESSGFSNCNLPMESQMGETSVIKNSFESDEATNNSQSLCRKDSAIEFWMVQPQELTIDMNSKGSRLLLINNSTQDLKFKTKFDGKVINICPISGILPAKDQVGLRISVSPFIKRMNESDQDIVTVTCGKTEKKVVIKVCTGRKPTTTVKDRTYICF